MARTPHRVERRAQVLASMLQQRVRMVRNAVAPEGQRPPFREQLSERQALAWWRKHRYDELGAEALAYLRPADILELDRALTEQAEQEQLTPGMGV